MNHNLPYSGENTLTTQILYASDFFTTMEIFYICGAHIKWFWILLLGPEKPHMQIMSSVTFSNTKT